MKKYLVNQDMFGWNDIDGDFLIYSTYTEQYHVLNDTGKTIFETIVNSIEPLNVKDIAEKLAEVYENENKADVESDIQTFLNQLCHFDILKEV
jgi:Zn-dependent M28 family amino/carboxypeptidase